jgi:hypothetical protein
MNKKLKNEIIKHSLSVLILAIITLVYFKPLLDGKDIRQSDMTYGEGMAKELNDYHEQTGEYSYWTNAMFSGMPSSFISDPPDLNVYGWFGRPIKMLTPYLSYAITFMMLICFYITFLLLGFDIWIALGASLAYAFCSYNMIIIEAGHITKAYAIAMMPLVMGGLIVAYQKNFKAGFILFMIGLGMLITQNHLQITYYTLLMAGVYVLVTFAYSIFEHSVLTFLKRSVILLIAIVLALLPNLYNLYPGYDYAKESIRGKSELMGKGSTGLGYDYAFAWSYGIKETLTLLVPNTMGGSSSMESMEQIEQEIPTTLETLRTQRFGQDPNQLLQQCSPYWGEQPFTSGPVYAGIVVVFLFVLSLFLLKGHLRVWAVLMLILSCVLAWGKHFPLMNDFLFDYLPFYNKFRTPAMSLVIATFVMVFFGFAGLKNLFDKKIKQAEKLKYLYISTAIVGGICFLLAIMPGMFLDFTSGRETLPEQLLTALQQDRAALCSSDAWRSFFFVLAAAALCWLVIKEKLKTQYIVVALSVLSLIDLWVVDKRYLNDNDFEEKKKTIAANYAQAPVNLAIDRDTTIGYRVLNLAANPFTDARASYYHHSIGGYHAAKLRRYQELVDSVMLNEINYFTSNINQATDDSSRNALLGKLTTLNMLNAKYFIFDYASLPFINNSVLGNAWFVDDVCLVNNANEEMDSIKEVNLSTTAIVNKEFAPVLSGWKPKQHSGSSSINLIKQTSNTCVYEVSATQEELAVFSEIYYPKFWQIDIDGKPTSMLRANYVLRAMLVPQGNHTITFKFIPTTWMNLRIVTLITSILIIISLCFVGYFSYKKSELFATPKQNRGKS